MPRTTAKVSEQNKTGHSYRRLADRSTKRPKRVDGYVGLKIRERRKELGLSQTALGETVGVAFQQVQKYEKGVNRVGASRLAAVAKVLQVPVDYFFPTDDQEKPVVSIPAEIASLTRRIRFLTKERERLRQLL